MPTSSETNTNLGNLAMNTISCQNLVCINQQHGILVNYRLPSQLANEVIRIHTLIWVILVRRIAPLIMASLLAHPSTNVGSLVIALAAHH